MSFQKKEQQKKTNSRCMGVGCLRLLTESELFYSMSGSEYCFKCRTNKNYAKEKLQGIPRRQSNSDNKENF